MAPPTILAHKSSFLTAQTLQLSQSLSPSPTWRTSNANSQSATIIPEEGESGGAALPDRLVEEVLYRANHTLQQHARRVYAPQASRHVAEQIEALYLEAAERAVRGDGAGGGGVVDDGEEEGGEEDAAVKSRGNGEAKFLRFGADFASDEVIVSLPSTWDLHSPSQAESSPSEAQRYTDLAATLTSVAARRRDVRARLDRLRRMRSLLAPLTSIDRHGSSGSPGIDNGGTGPDKVQPNLVTRNGELEKELERMRVLLVRVAGRVAQLPDPDPEPIAMEDLDVVERGKVNRLLGDF